jgi:hypothetical protein
MKGLFHCMNEIQGIKIPSLPLLTDSLGKWSMSKRRFSDENVNDEPMKTNYVSFPAQISGPVSR